MSQARPPLENATRFIAFLQQRYRGDRGALANLRAALSETRRYRAWPLLGGFHGAIGNPAFETVAALWAADADSHASDSADLGDALRKLSGEHNSFDGRFRRLLTCDRDEIAERVAPVVRAAQAKGVPVNYARLLSDLLCWSDDAKLRWAKSFWGAPEDEAALAAGLLDSDGAAPTCESAPQGAVAAEVAS
ncbi:MAG: type I-E CRISPR-associated protein Cse2/CasB [Lentisphaerae bacterium RIFOXYB12_FULL_65_16]|nr:MAG: type I-E CRISPR-associated protein Cse2/CasB [Lentisphaerae bacterium RIFOXYA12_64_32]OGV94029.1 MAG: type I-E CRISPR-associated protein Cse2/CasB [Lentisphaerae bacterium RIFOXYB12_FULL_65_16]